MRSHHLAAIVLLLALAACTAEPATPPPFTPGTSAPSPSPSASATVHPETAEEFIRRWRELVDETQITGNTHAYRGISRGCSPCDDFADRVDSIYRNGGYIRTDGSRILRITRGAPGVFDVRVTSGPTEYSETKGGKVTTIPGGEITLQVSIERSDRGWNLTDTTQLASTDS